jgi:hypothetical protein
LVSEWILLTSEADSKETVLAKVGVLQDEQETGVHGGDDEDVRTS